MKKVFSITLAFVLICLGCLAGCGQDLCKDGNHILQEIHVESTCQNPGYDSIYCENCSYNIITPIPKKACTPETIVKHLTPCVKQTTIKCKDCKSILNTYNTSIHDEILFESDCLTEQDYYYCKNCEYTSPVDYIKIPLTSNYTLGLNGNKFVKVTSDKLSFIEKLGADYVRISDIILKYKNGSEYKASSCNHKVGMSYTLFDVVQNTYRHTQYYPNNIESQSHRINITELKEVYIEFAALTYEVKYMFQDKSDLIYSRYTTVYSYSNFIDWKLPFVIDVFNPICAQTFTTTRVNKTYILTLDKDITVEMLNCDKINSTSLTTIHSISLTLALEI